MSERPLLTKQISPQDFQDFYWLKAELVAFCRMEGLPTQGGKLDIAGRILTYLKTGEKGSTKSVKKTKPSSKFDWKTAELTLQTVITDNYKNSENVRAFFQKHTKRTFKFNVKFMNWMKANVGKTLAEAFAEWERLEVEKKKHTGKKDIAPQFEYNRYLRDFLADNPDKTRAEGIACWKKKRAMRGDNIYKVSDLDK